MLILNRTRSGHDHNRIAANGDAVDLDLGLVRPELAADELVRSRDAHGLFHLRHGFERFETGGDVARAHRADPHALLAFDGVDLVPELFDPLAPFGDLFLA